MSVNIQLRFVATDLNPEHINDAIDVAHKFLVDEQGLDAFDMQVRAIGEDAIEGVTGWPAIISRSYLWVPEVTETWKRLMEEVNQGPCHADLECDYVDEM